MPTTLDTNEGPLYFYKHSSLLLHKDRLFAVDRSNYIGELMLTSAAESKAVMILTYPPVPFCPHRYLLRIMFQSPLNPPANTFYTGRSCAFYPMHYLPGDPGYIPHVAGRSRDFLTPGARLIQSWMRDAARDRIRNKILALAMGSHQRLGATSPLLTLGSDLLPLLIR